MVAVRLSRSFTNTQKYTRPAPTALGLLHLGQQLLQPTQFLITACPLDSTMFGLINSFFHVDLVISWKMVRHLQCCAGRGGDVGRGLGSTLGLHILTVAGLRVQW